MIKKTIQVLNLFVLKQKDRQDIILMEIEGDSIYLKSPNQKPIWILHTDEGRGEQVIQQFLDLSESNLEKVKVIEIKKWEEFK